MILLRTFKIEVKFLQKKFYNIEKLIFVDNFGLEGGLTLANKNCQLAFGFEIWPQQNQTHFWIC